MISYVKGELVAVDEEKIVIDVNGIGYGVFMPKQSITHLPTIGEDVKIHTYLNVKEDAMQLFGFLTKDDLEIFKLVIGVSGIGPKIGLNILSELSPDDLRFAVLSNDIKTIAKAPGLGKKTAEKLIVDLRDKLHIEDVLNSKVEQEYTPISSDNEVQAEAIQALVALGYGSSESMKAVRKVASESDGTVEDILKQALKVMMF